MTGRNWLLLSNPERWDVFGWWEAGNRDFGGWTIGRYFNDVEPGDNAALWVSGPDAGVYGIGRILSEAVEYADDEDEDEDEDDFWLVRPDPSHRFVEAEMDDYFFDAPIRKAELAADPDFAESLILRIPGGGNPSPLTDRQWAALTRHVPRRRPGAKTRVSKAVIMERALGRVRESIDSPREHLPAKRRQQRESRLLNAYARHLGRDLWVKEIVVPSGDRLVTDAYDRDTNTLIEAKASADRASIRMAIGQLLDYDRFVDSARQVILVPERPSDDLIALAKSQQISVCFRANRQFVTID